MSKEHAEVNFIDFKCPYCGSPLSYPETRLGTAQDCPLCFKIVVVPTRGSETGGKLPIPIRTPRLSIRPLKTEDQPDWLEFVTDEESYNYLDGDAPDEDEARVWLERSKAVRFTEPPNGYAAFAIELQESTKVIGSLSFWLYDREEHQQGGFQIMINPHYRGQGYGTETVLAVIDFGFRCINLHDIRVSVDSRNTAARRMLEKAKMKLEGEFVQDRRIKAEWVSTAWYGILREVYQKQASAPTRPA